MSHPYGPSPYGPPPRKKSNTGLIVGLTVGGLVLFGGCATLVAAVGTAKPSPSRTPLGQVQAATSQEPASEEPVAVETTPQAYTPVPADFKIRITVLKKACFGSAGCNITYRIKPSYGGPLLTDDQEFEVVYQVRGGDSGPQTNTFTMQGTKAEFSASEFLSTPSSSTRLTAKVTEVIGS